MNRWHQMTLGHLYNTTTVNSQIIADIQTTEQSLLLTAQTNQGL